MFRLTGRLMQEKIETEKIDRETDKNHVIFTYSAFFFIHIFIFEQETFLL